LKRNLALILVVIMLCSMTSVFAATVDTSMYGDERASGASTPIAEIRAIFIEAGVIDVPLDFWAAGSIALMIELGYMAPDADGNFNPEGELTNLTAIALFAKILGIADKNDSAEVAFAKAVASGLISSDTDSTQSMSRMEMARVMITALGIDPVPVNASQFRAIFSDTAQLSVADRAILNALYLTSYIRGYEDGTFRPDEILSRAEIAIIMDRILSSTN